MSVRTPGKNCGRAGCLDPGKPRTSENFGANKGSKDGLHYICRACAKKQQAEVDPERRKASRRKSELKKRERQQSRTILSYNEIRQLGVTEKPCRCELHQGSMVDIEQFHHDKNGDELTLAFRCKESSRKYIRGKAQERRMKKWEEVICKEAANSSKRRGWGECTITEQWVREQYERQGGCCYYFGIPLLATTDAKHPQKPSLDRIDSSKGYTCDNVVLCCWGANSARNTCGHATFLEFVKLVKAAARKGVRANS